MEDDDGLVQVPQEHTLKTATHDRASPLQPGDEGEPEENLRRRGVTSRSLSGGGELSDFLVFPLDLPTEFLRSSSSWSLAPPEGREAPVGRVSGGDASGGDAGQKEVTQKHTKK